MICSKGKKEKTRALSFQLNNNQHKVSHLHNHNADAYEWKQTALNILSMACHIRSESAIQIYIFDAERYISHAGLHYTNYNMLIDFCVTVSCAKL